MATEDHNDRPERRRSGLSATDLGTISELLRQGREEQRDHFDGKIADLRNMFQSGFPGGDPVEHRKVHESYIREAKERAELWHELRKKVLSGGVLAAFGVVLTIVGWLSTVAWEAFKRDYLR